METILCTKDTHVSGIFPPEKNFISMPTDEIMSLFQPTYLWFGPRKPLEKDLSFRQIIPYFLLAYKDKYMIYERTSRGGETRLHNKESIGIGGHVNTRDIQYTELSGEIDLKRTLSQCIYRELLEEVDVELMDNQNIYFTGIILGYDSDVDKVHMGIVAILRLASSKVYTNSLEVSNCRLVSYDELLERDVYLESWSHILLHNFISIQNKQLTLAF